MRSWRSMGRVMKTRHLRGRSPAVGCSDGRGLRSDEPMGLPRWSPWTPPPGGRGHEPGRHEHPDTPFEDDVAPDVEEDVMTIHSGGCCEVLGSRL